MHIWQINKPDIKRTLQKYTCELAIALALMLILALKLNRHLIKTETSHLAPTSNSRTFSLVTPTEVTQIYHPLAEAGRRTFSLNTNDIPMFSVPVYLSKDKYVVNFLNAEHKLVLLSIELMIWWMLI